MATVVGTSSSRDFLSRDRSDFGLGFWGLTDAAGALSAGAVVAGAGVTAAGTGTGTGAAMGTGMRDGAAGTAVVAGDGPARVGESGGLLSEGKPVGAG